MKRIVITCDGTWQDLSTPDPTNVRLLAQAIEPKDGDIEQLVYYAAGIGTRSAFDRLLGGAFGHGINIEIANAYSFLCTNYNLGDEIYIFGFSRGAYTARSLAGLIYTCGILKRENLSYLDNAYSLYRRREGETAEQTAARQRLAIELQKQKGHGQTSEDPLNAQVRIRFLGVWDTVGALGIPDLSRILRLDKRSLAKHRFHDTFVSPIVDVARHAVAVDERRKVFHHTEMNLEPKFKDMVKPGQLRQVWFPGDHGCVGGGGDGLPEGDPNKVNKRCHSDAALDWMLSEMEQSGPSHLKVSRPVLDLAPDPMSALGMVEKNFLRRLSDPLADAPPDNPKRDNRPFCAFEDLHPAVVRRWTGKTDYRPKNLVDAHGERLNAVASGA